MENLLSIFQEQKRKKLNRLNFVTWFKIENQLEKYLIY